MNIKYIIILLFVVSLTSCNSKINDAHNHDELDHSGLNHEELNDTDNHGDHSHGPELNENHKSHQEKTHDHGNKTLTLIENGYELYIESDVWVKNEVADITIHVTKLDYYKPLEAKDIGVLISGTSTQSFKAHQHGLGLYHLAYTPDTAESKQIRIGFKNDGEVVYLSISNLLVLQDHEDLLLSEEEAPGLINYTKEAAWKETFGLEVIDYVSTPRIIKTSGEIMPAPGDEFIVTALHAGTVSLNKTLIEGMQIKSGEVISTISSSLVHENMTNKYLRAKNEYEKAKLDYTRARNLIDEKLISEKEYLEAKLNYESSKNTFDNISKFYNDGNQQLKSPTDGFIRTVFVKEGQYIEEGQPIATIIRNKRVLIKAFIPQQYNHLSSSIFDANFSPVYTANIYSVKALNGSRISYSAALPDNSQFVPLYFEIDAHPDIMPGSYVEIYLKSASFEKQITVPTSALMEDQGNYYVYVQVDGEHYLKTYITLGDSDGHRAVVLSGLNLNDVLVSEGAYQIYLASLNNSAPSHAHSH